MGVFERLALASRKTDLDRGTWADLEKVIVSLLARGLGEAIAGPIYFGQAFEDKPFFTYSVTAEQAADAPLTVDHEVAKPTEELLNTSSTRGGNLNHIYDGSFEIMGRGGAASNTPSILTPNDQGSYTRMQYLPGQNYEKLYTWWLQSNDAGAKWQIASDKSAHGEYSAKIVLDQAESRWLYPIDFTDVTFNSNIMGKTYPFPASAFYSWIISEQGAGTPWLNPVSTSNTVHSKVYATEPCDIEFEVLVSGMGAWQLQEYGTSISKVVNGVEVFGWKTMVPIYHRGTYRITPDKWNDVQWTFPIPYYDLRVNGVGDRLLVKTSFRVVGTPGTTVWVDDQFVDANQRTTNTTSFTVGVANWILDANDFYVGANLWIKSGTPFIVNEIIPPWDNPCTNPKKTGTNVLADPNVESQATTYGTGPLGYEIPMRPTSLWYPLTFSDGSAASEKSNFATDHYSAPDAHRWRLSTASPDTGSYHVRQTLDTNLYGYGDLLYLAGVKICDKNQMATAVVNPGDSATFSFRAKASTTGGGPRVWWGIDWYRSTGALLSRTEPGAYGTLATSYQTFTVSGTAPTNATHGLARINWNMTDLDFPGGPVTFDADTFVFGLT